MESIFIGEYYVRTGYEWQGGSESYMFWQKRLWLFFDEDEWNKLDWVAGLDSVYLEDCHAASSSIRLLINHLNLQHRATNKNLGREYAEILKWDCKTVEKKIVLYLP